MQVRVTLPLLRSHDLNVVGNVEPLGAMAGDCDVLVCDGFVGNILLKAAEGAVVTVVTLLRLAPVTAFAGDGGARKPEAATSVVATSNAGSLLRRMVRLSIMPPGLRCWYRGSAICQRIEATDSGFVPGTISAAAASNLSKAHASAAAPGRQSGKRRSTSTGTGTSTR